MNIEDIFSNSVYDMELEKIKSKIMRLYSDLLTKAYKASNPAASEEQINEFLEDNSIEFKGSGFDDEAERLEDLLDLLVHEDDLDEAAKRKYDKYDVEKGQEPKDKQHDKLFKAPTKPFDIAGGGMFTPKESKYRPSTKPLSYKKSSLKRLIDDDPKVDTKSLQDIWDAEREKLLELVKKRNKEHGIKFW